MSRYILCLSFLAILITGGYAKGDFCHEPHVNETIHLPCDNILDVVKKCNSEFVLAAMNHSDPFTICTNNFTFISKRIASFYFEKLYTTLDHKNASTTCADKLLNKNIMNVISTLVKTSETLWETANCDLCYSDLISVEQNFSNNTQHFMALHENFTQCASTHSSNSSAVCVECDDYYASLNNFYDHIKKSSGKVCFDLEDKMNKSRIAWSVTFKCCRGKRDSLTAFFSLSSSVFIISISFYVAVYFVGSKNPETETLDERQIVGRHQSETEPRSTASSSSQSMRQAQPVRKLVINQDDSDDEILAGSVPKSPQNLITLDN